jgi:hypothetical protein
MLIKRVSIGDMFGWIGNTFGMVFGNAGTMFGAGFLMLVVVLLMMVPSFFVMGPFMTMTPAAGAAPDMSQLLPRMGFFYGLMLVLNLVLMPPLVLGWMRLMRDVDESRGSGPLTIFHVFSDTPAWLVGIRLSLLTIVLAVVVVGVFVALFWTSGSAFFAQATAAAAAKAAGLPPPEGSFPLGLFAGYFLFIFVVMFLQFAYYLGMTELALRGGTATGALSGALRALLSNAPRLVMWGIILFVLGFVLVLVLGLLLGLIIAALAAISPNILMVVMFALYVPFLLLMYPLMHASAYVSWKDLLGSDMVRDADEPGQVSA